MDKKQFIVWVWTSRGNGKNNHSQKSHSANGQPWNVFEIPKVISTETKKKIQNTTPTTTPTINLQVELFSTTNLPGYTVPWTLGNSSNLQRCVVSRDSRIGHATAGPPKKDGQNLWLF